MHHLKRSLTQQLNSPRTGAVIFFFVLALLGFADATYLTIEHYMNVIPPCTTSGCEVVLTSAYSMMLGLPDSLWGMFDYVAILIGVLIYIEARFVSGDVKPRHLAILKWTLMFTAIGFLTSVWLVYLQAFVIHSFCQYCLGSAAISTLLFITAAIILSKNAKADAPIVPPLL